MDDFSDFCFCVSESSLLVFEILFNHMDAVEESYVSGLNTVFSCLDSQLYALFDFTASDES